MRNSEEVIRLRKQVQRQQEILLAHDLESLRAESAAMAARTKKQVDPAVVAAEKLDAQIARDLQDKGYVELLRRAAWLSDAEFTSRAWAERHRDDWLEPPPGWPSGQSAASAVREAAKAYVAPIPAQKNPEPEPVSETSLHRLLIAETE